MLVLGIILTLIGWLAGWPLIFWIGVALAVIGAVLLLLDLSGRRVGPRRYW